MPRAIIAILNQKGGVGKTTTAINLAAALGKLKRSVLLVDLDPQGNATGGLGIDKSKLVATVYDVLFGRVSVENVVVDTDVPGLQLLPAASPLAAAEVELVPEMARELKLAKALEGVNNDIVLIDCPPSLGLLSINALAAATHLLIPVQTEYFALEGLGQLMQVMQRVRSGINPNLELLGVVMTMYDSRTSLSDQVKQEVENYFSQKVFDAVIPRNVRLAEAPSFGQTIFEYERWSKGARAYKMLAKEFLKRLDT